MSLLCYNKIETWLLEKCVRICNESKREVFFRKETYKLDAKEKYSSEKRPTN